MKGLRHLLALMLERHRIWMTRRTGAAKPWTKDKILQQYRFCNVYRELDTVTIWVRQHVREPFAKHPHLWFMLCIARHFNLPTTLEALMKGGAWPDAQWNPHRAANVLAKLEGPAYTGAYMINPPTRAELVALQQDYGRQTKVAWSCLSVLHALWKDRAALREQFELSRTLWQAHQVLLPYRGWAGFMAYEVVSDLRWTRYLRRAPDVTTWCHMGPGALRGLQRVYGRPLAHKPPQDLALREARELLAELNKAWPRTLPDLEMREVEHSLCEFDKYERVRLGQGRPRQSYPGV